MRPRSATLAMALVTAVLPTLFSASCDKDQQPGHFEVVFDWSDTTPPSSSDHSELWVRGRIERRPGEDRSAWTVSAESPSVAYSFTGDTELAFSAVPNEADEILVVVLEIAAEQDRSSAALFFGESEPFAIQPEQQLTVPVRMQTRRTPHLPDGADPEGDITIVEAGAGEGYVNSPMVTLSFVGTEASQVVAANDLSFSLGTRSAELGSLDRDGERYLWPDWNLDADLCPASPCPDGLRRVYLKLVNAEGYASPVFSAQAIVDTTAPVPNYSAATPALVRADGAVLLQVTLAEPLQDSSIPEANAQPESGNAIALGAATVSDDHLTLSWRHLAQSGQDGSYTLLIDALCDRVGNCNDAAITTDLEGNPLTPFVIDATPPVITTLSTASAVYSARGGHDLVEVRLQAGEQPKRAEVWIDEQRITDSCAVDSGDPSLFACSHLVVDDGSAPGGTRVVYATIWDTAGNTGGANHQIRFDFEAPVLLSPVVAPAQANAASTVRVSFSFSEPVTGTVGHWDGLPFSGGGDGQDFSYSYTVQSGVGDGVRHFAVSTSDQVGNPLDQAALGTLTLDATAPGIEDGSSSVNPGSVKQGDSFTIAFTATEPLLLAPVVQIADVLADSCSSNGLVTTCTHSPAAGDLDGFKEITVRLLDLAENPALLSVGQVEYDNTAPGVAGATLIRMPFDAPALDVDRTWFSVRDPFSDDAVTARLYVYADEGIAGTPQLNAVGPSGASLPFVHVPGASTLAEFSYTFSAAESYSDGSYTFSVSWADAAGNLATRALPVGLELQSTAPAGTLLDLGQTVHRRIPWGAEQSSGVPQFSLDGSLGASSSVSHVLAFRTDDDAPGNQIGSAVVEAATGDFAITQLAGGDLAQVHAMAVDRSGARGPLQAITRGEWIASLGLKEPGSSSLNPHRFEMVADFPASLFSAGSAGVSEAGATQLGRDDGTRAQVRGEAGWKLLQGHGPTLPNAPSPRHDHAMAFDSARGRAVLFGGAISSSEDSEETWEWDGQAWHLLDPATRPSARHGHTMVYDAARGVVLMYGGKTASGDWGETWEFNGRDWWQRSPVQSPCSRYFSSMAYDSLRQRSVLFGGFSEPTGACGTGASLGPNDETWEWDGQGWMQIVAAAPSARESHTMAFDRNTGLVVMFGGLDLITDSLAGDTWTWDGNSWVSVTAVGPAARLGASSVYDSSRDELLLFGGYASGNPQHLGNYADSWTWTGSNWSPADSAVSPSARHGHTLVHDAARGQLLMFGGNTATGLSPVASNSIWIRETGQWSQRHPDVGPSARIDHAMVFDAVRGQILLHGGSTSPTECDRGLWFWDGDSWQSETPAVSPTACHKASLIHDSSRGKTVLYRGEYFSGGFSLPVNETWEWDGATWSEPVDTGRPSSLYGSAMVYDSTLDRGLLYGGNFTCTQTETWAWGVQSSYCLPSDEACWNRLVRPSLPDTCSLFAMAYDADRDRAVLMGGNGASQACIEDTWEFGLWGAGTCAYPAEPCWKQVTPATRPAALQFHAMVYDPGRQKTVLFGGGQCANPTVYSAETWEWDGSTWTRLDHVTAPARRQRHAMAYDPDRGKVVMFGGNAGSGRDAETWEWDRDSVRPGQVLRADLAAARLDSWASLDTVEVRVITGGQSQLAGTETPGAQLMLWDTDGWQPLPGHDAPPDSPVELSWSPTDVDDLSRLLYRDTLNLAVVPLGNNGTGLAEVSSDYAELRIEYTLP